MERMAAQSGAKFLLRDAGNLKESSIAVLVGTAMEPLNLPDCGYCGFTDCAAMTAAGGICAFNAGDLGIALGSAVSVAAAHHVDNRIMFSVGRAALNLNLFGPEVKIAYGIPLRVSGKNPFFDRRSPR
jgi:uncharacterized ferredoxin-like protein